ncbi:MAG: tRNA glutamyl-Q(34) synthetase GluQRS [Hellea sp.]
MMRTRFAPSPTGRLHLGHVLAAKEAFGFGPPEDSTCLLRIEDIDHTRCKHAFTLGIFEDLNWLGFDWPIPVRLQSRHYTDYAKVIASLLERGLAYPCGLTRAELKAGQEPDSQASLSVSEFLTHFTADDLTPLPAPSLPYAIRLNISKATDSISERSLTFIETGQDKDYGRNVDAAASLIDWAKSNRPDPIIARKDIGVSYHIAVTHDDHHQGISHIVRGMDLFEETPLHILIQQLMGWTTPIYHHHPLLRREDGEKLSKRGLDTSIESLRENSLTAAQVLAMAYP